MKKFFSGNRKLAIASLILLVLPWKVSYAAWDVTKLYAFGLSGQSIYFIIDSVMRWILSLVGIIGIIGFAISGILYLTSAGMDEQMKTAKNAMKYSIVGIVVALSGLVILQAVYWMLSGSTIF